MVKMTLLIVIMEVLKMIGYVKGTIVCIAISDVKLELFAPLCFGSEVMWATTQ